MMYSSSGDMIDMNDGHTIRGKIISKYVLPIELCWFQFFFFFFFCLATFVNILCCEKARLAAVAAFLLRLIRYCGVRREKTVTVFSCVCCLRAQ